MIAFLLRKAKIADIFISFLKKIMKKNWMKRLIFLSFCLLAIVFLSACSKLPSSDADRQTIWSETGNLNSSGFFEEQKDANQIWEGLDRNLISRPLNFKECIEKNNNRPLSPDGKRGVQPPTSGSEISWTYCYRDESAIIALIKKLSQKILNIILTLIPIHWLILFWRIFP